MDTRTRRPDLERLPYKAPNYLTPQIFPFLPRAMKQGVLYYADIQTETAAETGRSGGTAPTAVNLSDAHTTYDLDTDEFIKRMGIPDAEIPGFGGLDAAQQVAARKGKRSVGLAIEDLTVANVLANASVTYVDILNSLIGAVDLGRDTLMDRADGQIAFVCSSRIFNRIKRYDTIIDRMKFTGVMASGIRDVRSISAAQLAAALNVDAILVGPNSEWYDDDADYQDRAALMVLPDPSAEPIEELQAGRTVWFSADGIAVSADTMFEIHSYYSDNLLSEQVDVRAYAEQHMLNTELIYGLDGIDEDNTVTTTTTTTT